MMSTQNLFACLTNSDKPSGPTGHGWEAGQQLEALRFYLHPNVRIVATHKDRAHEGMLQAVMQAGSTWYVFADDFGDGPENDILAGAAKHRGFEYIQRVLTLRLAPFSSPDEAVNWLYNPGRMGASWSSDNFEGLLNALRTVAAPA